MYLSSPPSAAASSNVRCASAADAPRIAATPDTTSANANTRHTRHIINSCPLLHLSILILPRSRPNAAAWPSSARLTRRRRTLQLFDVGSYAIQIIWSRGVYWPGGSRPTTGNRLCLSQTPGPTRATLTTPRRLSPGHADCNGRASGRQPGYNADSRRGTSCPRPRTHIVRHTKRRSWAVGLE